MISVGISDENLQDIYSDPYIKNIAHDNMIFAPVIHPLAFYISAWVDNVFAGSFLIIRFSKTEIEAHSLLKKEFIPYSRELGKETLRWLFNQEDTLRVTTFIPSYLKSAMNYVKKIGFKEEGIKRDATTKDGKITDIHLFGITKNDWRQQ